MKSYDMHLEAAEDITIEAEDEKSAIAKALEIVSANLSISQWEVTIDHVEELDEYE